MDLKKRRWSSNLLEKTFLSIDNMPRLIEGTEISGKLKLEIANTWGISKPPVVAGGGGDNAASACGLGVVNTGDAFISIGTSGVMFVVSEKFVSAVDGGLHSFCHSVQNKWHLMSVMLSATDSLNWYSQITGKSVSKMILFLSKFGEKLLTKVVKNAAQS